jgi:hypothetical protein
MRRGGLLGGKSKDGGDGGGEQSGAAGSSSNGSSAPASGSSSSGRLKPEDALVPSGPERKHHKVFVVELSRKPLFPGIYTPLLVNKNEALVKEIMELKKQGCARIESTAGAHIGPPGRLVSAVLAGCPWPPPLARPTPQAGSTR